MSQGQRRGGAPRDRLRDVHPVAEPLGRSPPRRSPAPRDEPDRAEPDARAPDDRSARPPRGEDEGQPHRGRRAAPHADALRSPDALRRSTEEGPKRRSSHAGPAPNARLRRSSCVLSAAVGCNRFSGGDRSGGRHRSSAGRRPGGPRRSSAAPSRPSAAGARRGRGAAPDAGRADVVRADRAPRGSERRHHEHDRVDGGDVTALLRPHALARDQGARHGLHRRQGRHHPHEQPRRRGRRRDHRQALGRANVPGQGRGRRRAHRHRGHPDRRVRVHAAAARRLRRDRRGRLGRRDRQSVRPLAHGERGDHQRQGAHEGRRPARSRPATTTFSRPTRRSTPATPAGRSST